MSGESAVELLREQFERVRSAELVRLRKKINRLSDAERAEVEAISAEVIGALTARFREGFTTASAPHVAAVVNLFGLHSFDKEPNDPSVR